ncbi:MAG: S1 RNA-binding domain-containing protein [Anaerolineales bacterium]
MPDVTANQLAKKDHVSGKVVKTTLAGAVVDLGEGRLAVVPISQLRKEAVRRVEDVVKQGDQVEAWVRRVDPEHGRIELTMIQPLGLDWRDLKKDMVVKGKVVKLEKFGAFVDLGAERPGLLHVSEMSHDYVKRPEDVVSIGQDVEVKVLDVDRRKKQIKLSIKALTPQAVAEPEKPKRKEEPEEPEEPEKPAPTAMEVALRKAMSAGEQETKGQSKNSGRKEKSPVMEDILARTLESRPKSR